MKALPNCTRLVESATGPLEEKLGPKCPKGFGLLLFHVHNMWPSTGHTSHVIVPFVGQQRALPLFSRLAPSPLPINHYLTQNTFGLLAIADSA